MPANAKDIQVQLVTEIQDQDRRETMEIEETGRFLVRGSTQVLTFTEHPEDGEPVHTMVTIKPEHVSIKRTGGVEMRQVFKPLMETENLYHHTYGDFHMKTYTKEMNYTPLEESVQGRLFLNYTMTLNHEVTQAHSLTLTFEEESDS